MSLIKAGSNSKANFAHLDALEFPYVASLTPSYHTNLLKVSLSHYREVKVGEHKLLVFRDRKVVWGKERTVVVYISEKLREGQLRGLETALAKKFEKLRALKERLNLPRARRKTKDSIEAKIKDILKGERGKLLITYSIIPKGGGRFDIQWEIDRKAYRWVSQHLFGKRILVTCRKEWTDEEIISAYFGQSNIERVFRHFKNPYHNCVQPQFHWTDQKIKVHTFICLTGLLLSQVLLKKAKDKGYTLGMETLIDKLTEIRQVEIITLTGLKGKPVKEERLEDVEPELMKLYKSLAE